MDIGVKTFSSELHNEENLKEKKENIFKTLNSISENLSFYPVEGETEKDITLFLILTGGVEGKAINVLERYPHPIILLADSKDNSLAAALEITAKLNDINKTARIIMTDKRHELLRIKRLIPILQTVKKLHISQLGIIGNPSDWLIASKTDDKTIKEVFGIKTTHIPLKEVEDRFKEISEGDAEEVASRFIKNAKAVIEPDRKDIIKAAKLYLSIKRLIKTFHIDAFTIRCFDLIYSLQTTGCLALSLLNDEGIVAGCEGDIPSLLSMFISHLLTGNYPFMGNIADIDVDTLTVAHCTIPTKATKSYTIRTHFESGKGVGIQGDFSEGEVTLLRIGGEKLDRYITFSGITEEVKHSEQLCRTQVKIKLEEKPDILLYHPLGNHIVILQGRYTEDLEELFRFLNIKKVQEHT